MRVLPFVLVLLASACASHHAEPGSRAPRSESKLPPAPELPELAEELVGMAAEDQKVRGDLMTFLRKHPGEDPPMGLALRMLATDTKNTARMKEIVAEHGWPTPALVGAEATHAAWLLTQHADSDPDFQAAVLDQVEPWLESGAVERGDFALLTDRVLVARKQPQRYGTQYGVHEVDGVNVLRPATPIEDPATLDARRAAMGLGPHAEYVERVREAMGLPRE